MVAAGYWLDNDNIKLEECDSCLNEVWRSWEKPRKYSKYYRWSCPLYGMVYLGSTRRAPRILIYSSNRRWSQLHVTAALFPSKNCRLLLSCRHPAPPTPQLSCACLGSNYDPAWSLCWLSYPCFQTDRQQIQCSAMKLAFSAQQEFCTYKLNTLSKRSHSTGHEMKNKRQSWGWAEGELRVSPAVRGEWGKPPGWSRALSEEAATKRPTGYKIGWWRNVEEPRVQTSLSALHCVAGSSYWVRIWSLIWYDIWYDMWYYMWYDIWCDIIWYDMLYVVWYDMVNDMMIRVIYDM